MTGPISGGHRSSILMIPRFGHKETECCIMNLWVRMNKFMC